MNKHCCYVVLFVTRKRFMFDIKLCIILRATLLFKTSYLSYLVNKFFYLRVVLFSIKKQSSGLIA